MLTAAPFLAVVPLLVELDAPLDVPALPPVFAEKLIVDPEVCDPALLDRPGAVPAPSVKYFEAPDGVAGMRVVPTTHEGSLSAGHEDAAPLVL